MEKVLNVLLVKKDIKNNYEFKHNCNTDSGSSGSPILLLSNSTVIGIHKVGLRKY